jgi:hypothetical protein
LREIVVNGAASIHERWEYDNWDGGTYGHALTLAVPEVTYIRFMGSGQGVSRRIATDINKINNTHKEHISEVFIEMVPANNDRWREESGVYRPRTGAITVPADALQRIWGSGHVRLFLSHKASIKVGASRLKGLRQNKCRN